MLLTINIAEIFPKTKLEEGYAVRLVDTRELTAEDRKQWTRLQAHRTDVSDPARRLLIPGHGAVTFAEFKGEPVGCFSVKKSVDLVTASNKHVIVLPEHRRKGLFMAMAGAQWRYCIDENIQVIRTTPMSRWMQKFWFDLGAERLSEPWGYSKKTVPRGAILFDALSPFLEESGDTFLDVDCGYSPMAASILDHGHTITGLDIDPWAIQHLQKTQPRGEWIHMDDVDAQLEGYTVLLFLGVTTALQPVYSSTYYETAERLLQLNKPRIVVVESADAANQELYTQVCQLLENHGKYMKKQEERYDAELEKASKRHFSIWVRQWNYAFWRRLFMNAEDDEIDGLHERYYKTGGRTIHPLVVYGVISPRLCVKDRLVKKLILEKDGLKTMLNVAFWEGKFAFNMGFEGFEVTGVEVYRRAVDVAKQTQSTLPPEIAARFKFNYGLAEHLEEYPRYDIVVNHCLEHVRDPRHVMKESLDHVKPGGYAYFTPPLKHGADSPTHLHHFMTEQDLLDLLPEGYTANIYKTKLQESDHKVNIFVMEVSEE